MSANEIHVGDIGTIIEVTIKDGASVLDISSFTTKQFIFKRPDNTTVTKNASFSTDGSDGKLRYTIVSGDLNQQGLGNTDNPWKLQVYLATVTNNWRSDIISFDVYGNL